MQYKEIEYHSKEEWHSIRQKHIGGSDCATIMGYNEWKNPVELWREKTGRKVPDDLSSNKAIIRGKNSEPHLIGLFSEKYTEYEVSTLNKTLESLKYPFMSANLDGVLIDKNGDKGVLEIKTATCFNKSQFYDIWLKKDEDGKYTITDIPIHYWLQIQHYLAVTGWKYAVLFADITLAFQKDRSALHVYKCSRNEEAIKQIIKKELEFNSYIINDIEPVYRRKITI